MQACEHSIFDIRCPQCNDDGIKVNPAIEILKRSIDNLKGEALRKKGRIDHLEAEKIELEADIEMVIKRINELEESIKQLEGKKDEPTSSKSKKTKR